jgi:hypothetical protein
MIQLREIIHGRVNEQTGRVRVTIEMECDSGDLQRLDAMMRATYESAMETAPRHTGVTWTSDRLPPGPIQGELLDGPPTLRKIGR